MSRDLVWSGPADRDLRRLDPQTATRVREALIELATTGRDDVRPLQGRERQWRLRVGDWRAIFRYQDDLSAVLVGRVLPRDRAYRD